MSKEMRENLPENIHRFTEHPLNLDNKWVAPSPDHYSALKGKEWTAEEITDFIKEHCQGLDLHRPSNHWVLMWSPYIEIPAVSPAGILIPESARRKQKHALNLQVGLILDYGPNTCLGVSRYPTGILFERGQWYNYVTYDIQRTLYIPELPLEEGDNKFDVIDGQIITRDTKPRPFELRFVRDDALQGPANYEQVKSIFEN